jgi:RNA polymerase sigma factor (sigma-70 family)
VERSSICLCDSAERRQGRIAARQRRHDALAETPRACQLHPVTPCGFPLTSRLPSQEDFESWRKAFNAREERPGLVEFVDALASAAAATSTLAGLCPAGEWTKDALKETVGDFWCNRLLTGTLEQAFQKTDSPSAFGRYLERSLRNMLIDAKRAAGTPRLRARIQAILAEGKFESVTTSSDRGEEVWGPSGDGWSAVEIYDGDELSLLSHLHSLGLEETLQSSDGRADVVISNKELARLINGLFEQVHCRLSLNQLATVFRQRFVAHYPPPMVSDDESAQEISDDEGDLVEVLDAREIASRVLAALSDRQAVILLERHHENRTLEEIASVHGCSRGTADNEVRRGNEVVRQYVDADRLALVWKALIDLTSEGIEVLEAIDNS